MCNDRKEFKGCKAQILWRSNDFQTSFYDTIELHAAPVDWHWMMSGIKDMGPNEVASLAFVWRLQSIAYTPSFICMAPA